MLAYKEDEELVIRYPAKLKKYGDGVLYVTSQRLCFESDKAGVCFDLDYVHLFDWYPKRKSIVVRWQELEEGQTQHEKTDPIFTVEIELRKRDNKKVDPKDVHYTIYYAYTKRFIHNSFGAGWYFNERDELIHRLDPKRNPSEPTSIKHTNIELEELAALAESADWESANKKYGMMDHITKNSGYTILDQLRYERIVMRNAWKKDGVWNDDFGVSTPKGEKSEKDIQITKDAKISMIKIYENKIKKYTDIIKTEKAKDKNWKPTEHYTPSALNGVFVFKGGNMYDYVEGLKEGLRIYKRINQIIKDMEFDFREQLNDYADKLYVHLFQKIREGVDIENYDPQTMDKSSSAVEEAKRKIAIYRKNLTESP